MKQPKEDFIKLHVVCLYLTNFAILGDNILSPSAIRVGQSSILYRALVLRSQTQSTTSRSYLN